MMFRNNNKKYGLVHKALHWGIGFAIIGLIAVGMYMEEMPSSATKWQLYSLHKGIGISVLMFVIIRLIWRFTNVIPPMPEGMKKYEKFAAHAAHLGLYVLMISMPLSGWIMSSAGGHPVNIFSYVVPPIVEKGSSLGSIAHSVHGAGGTIMMWLVILHVAAALYHHFVKKDDVLKRMTH